MRRTLCTTYASVKQFLLLHDETHSKTAVSHAAILGVTRSSPNGKVDGCGWE